MDTAPPRRSRAPKKTAAAKAPAEVDVASDDEEGAEEVQEPKKRRKNAANKQVSTQSGPMMISLQSRSLRSKTSTDIMKGRYRRK